MSLRSPLGALCAGLVAGFAGALAQSLFFAATRKLAPTLSANRLEAPAAEQRSELPTRTVARPMTEQLAAPAQLLRNEGAARAVHLGFGSAWGALYGLAAGTLPLLGTPKNGVAFGMIVWLVSDDVLLPALRLRARPQHSPVQSHLHGLAGHAVYGAVVASTFAALGRAATPAAAAVGSFWLTRRVPRPVRPAARRVVDRSIRVALPVRDAWLALT